MVQLQKSLDGQISQLYYTRFPYSLCTIESLAPTITVIEDDKFYSHGHDSIKAHLLDPLGISLIDFIRILLEAIDEAKGEQTQMRNIQLPEEITPEFYPWQGIEEYRRWEGNSFCPKPPSSYNSIPQSQMKCSVILRDLLRQWPYNHPASESLLDSLLKLGSHRKSNQVQFHLCQHLAPRVLSQHCPSLLD